MFDELWIGTIFFIFDLSTMRVLQIAIVFVSILLVGVYSYNIEQFSESNVVERELVTETVTVKSILEEHDKPSKNINEKVFKGTTLAYVTPWNNKGYDIAKIFNCKFDYVSPVWYRVTHNDKDKLVLAGRQDVDQGWLGAVRQTADKCAADSRPRLVPRFHFEGWSGQRYAQLFGEGADLSTRAQALIGVIVDECKKQNFDGIVLDQGYIAVRAFGDKMYQFLTALADRLHEQQKVLILVVPPIRSADKEQQAFTSEDFVRLMDHVDYFSLMTYDFSSSAGPNAPLPWVTQALLSLVPAAQRNEYATKVLLGLNFYGYDFTKGAAHEAVLGHKVIELLSKKKQTRVEWDEKSFEHYFNYKDEQKRLHVVYYPSLKSIQERLELAHSVGAGVAIWEVGQGLDYFYDLL